MIENKCIHFYIGNNQLKDLGKASNFTSHSLVSE